MPPVGFEPMIPVSEPTKIVHTLDRAATVIVTYSAIRILTFVPLKSVNGCKITYKRQFGAIVQSTPLVVIEDQNFSAKNCAGFKTIQFFAFSIVKAGCKYLGRVVLDVHCKELSRAP
jgi:hypothetical protein